MPMSLVASLLLCGTAAAAEKYPTEGGVVVLDPTNFAGFIAEQEYTIVEFYAPWYARSCSCSGCSLSGPAYAAALPAQQLTPPEDTAAASRLEHCPACCTTALHWSSTVLQVWPLQVARAGVERRREESVQAQPQGEP